MCSPSLVASNNAPDTQKEGVAARTGCHKHKQDAADSTPESV